MCVCVCVVNHPKSRVGVHVCDVPIYDYYYYVCPRCIIYILLHTDAAAADDCLCGRARTLKLPRPGHVYYNIIHGV